MARFTATKITLADATITAIPSGYASQAGGGQNLAVFDELWAYTQERAWRLFDELVPVPTRKIACRLTVTHAGFENESTLLLDLYKRGTALPLVGKDLHAGSGMLCFWTHDMVAPWQDERWLQLMARSLRPVQYTRMIGNAFTASESGFIDMAWWDAISDRFLGHMIADPNLLVYAAVDASVKRDSTALVAVTWDKDNQRVRLATHKIFQPNPDAPLDFEQTIEATLLDWHRRYNLKTVWYDPFRWSPRRSAWCARACAWRSTYNPCRG